MVYIEHTKGERDMEKIIEVNHLSKSYGDVWAVKDVSFNVEQGMLFAFLGPNGAGKSTTINSICTFLKPDKGKVLVNGYKLGEQDGKIRDSIGVVFQESVLDRLLTVEENLSLRGSFYNLRGKELKEAVANAAAATEIGNLLKRPYGKLSGGQRRRADIARALLHTPKILFLDEPTTGLHMNDIECFYQIVCKLVDAGNTVVIIEHNLDIIRRADWIIDLGPEGGKNGGEILFEGTPEDLKSCNSSITARYI